MNGFLKAAIKVLLVVALILAGAYVYFRFYATPEAPEAPIIAERTPPPAAPPEETHGPEIELIWYGGIFELPINGATGFASRDTRVYLAPDASSEVIYNLAAGQGFTILDEDGDWWKIQIGNEEGFVLHSSAFINLPDVLPSIRYDITNAYSSLKRSSLIDIPNVSGYALYEAWAFNPRLDRYEFIVPALYSTAKLLAVVQRSALLSNNTVILFEAFRPHATQRLVVENLSALMAENPAVDRGINTPPWSISWFISTGISNHQRGAAVDVSFAFVLERETRVAGRFAYIYITNYEQRIMPTEMHELSALAASLEEPVAGHAWRDVFTARSMTQGSRLLRTYFTEAGFTPVASEWWHFDDREGSAIARSYGLQGDFFIDSIYSFEPWLNQIEY
ncbi:MAG: SH3 domain-containing protein [Oscillospiraceae bacterium]|nr:SH3 domain-containing protein [Oscillospiraceae bacterium]MCL2277962.1 SH3 domain-containing protein [Oscillospiraceae bacterium]